jgi:hypothetical protein
MRRTIDITLANHPDLVGWLYNLAGEIQARTQRAGKIEDIEQYSIPDYIEGEEEDLITQQQPGVAAIMRHYGGVSIYTQP